MAYKPTVSLDFDGVLHTYVSGWTGYEPTDGPEPGAQDFVRSLIDAGYELVVVSSRADTTEGRLAIVAWLKAHGFSALKVTNQKVAAVAYVDDRAVPYETGSQAWDAARASIDTLAERNGRARPDGFQR